MCSSDLKNTRAVGRIISKEETVLAGVQVAKLVFKRVSPDIQIREFFRDADIIKKNEILMEVQGDARAILKAERIALNFLGRMSGIAHKTRSFVNQLEGFKTQVLDTRKTSPGLRIVEKAATAIGGARNHRLCLTDGVLVKENHIRAAGSITSAVNRLLESLPPTLKIEVEVENLKEVHEALDAGADLIMLDNMSIPEMKLAVRTVRGRVLLEASGNITIENVKEIAATGVDFISTSSILHSAPWADLSLLFEV